MKHTHLKFALLASMTLVGASAMAQSTTAQGQYLGKSVAPVLAVELDAAPARAQQAAPAATTSTSATVSSAAASSMGTSQRLQSLDGPSTYTGLAQSERFRSGADLGYGMR